jgi:hypothetical protein
MLAAPTDPDGEQNDGRAQSLGLPADALWRHIWTPAPIHERGIFWRVQSKVRHGPEQGLMLTFDFITPLDKVTRGYLGYSLDYFGLDASWDTPATSPWPRFRLRTVPGGTPAVDAHILQGIAYPPGLAIEAEMRWLPPTAQIAWIIKGNTPPAPTAADAGAQALQLIRHQASYDGRGRPEGSRDYTASNRPLLVRRVATAVIWLVKDNQRVSKTSVAKVMLEGRGKVGRTIDEAGIDLATFGRRVGELIIDDIGDEDIIDRLVAEYRTT